MKLTAKIKLLPTEEQRRALLDTLETANAACNYMSDVAWEAKVFRQYALHHLVYHDTRERFGLSAQVTVRCIAKVAHAYKLDRKVKRTFRPTGAIAYDDRILSWNCEQGEVSIWTTTGRQRVPYACGLRQRELLQGQRGESDLCLIGGEFYLFVACEVETPPAYEATEFLGVDLGIVNIATTSDGESFSGEGVERRRQWYARRRATLQAVGTKSAKRRLRKLSGRQQRFQTDTNHRISKALVETAQDTGRGIALEDLKGIRKRATVRRGQRARHHNWAFYQLRQFVSYKAVLAGVPVQLIDPRHTSQTCPSCNHVSRSNRPSRDRFACSACGYAGPADHVAAINIAARATVNSPMVSTEMSKANVVGNCDIA